MCKFHIHAFLGFRGEYADPPEFINDADRHWLNVGIDTRPASGLKGGFWAGPPTIFELDFKHDKIHYRV
jgi:hypothetical protein